MIDCVRPGVSARDNIEDAVGQVSEAWIVGLISRPELNGELCTLGEYVPIGVHTW